MRNQLIERLRGQYNEADHQSFEQLVDDAREAAAAIESLRAENQALKKDAARERIGKLYRDESTPRIIKYKIDNPFGPVAISIPAAYPQIADWIDQLSGAMKLPSRSRV